MKVCYCDACSAKTDRPNKLPIPCHLWSKRGTPGYVDNDWNAVSGRRDELDLCNACCNAVYSQAVRKVLEIRNGDDGA